MSAGSRTSEVGRCVRLAATSSQRCLLPIPIVGRIASVAILPNGYFSDFILPIIILIRLVTLTNNARCYFFMHSLKLLLLAGTSETLQIEQDNILGSVQV